MTESALGLHSSFFADLCRSDDSSVALGSLFVRLQEQTPRMDRKMHDTQHRRISNKRDMTTRVYGAYTNDIMHLLGPRSMRIMLQTAEETLLRRFTLLCEICQKNVQRSALAAWRANVRVPKKKRTMEMQWLDAEELGWADLQNAARKLVGFMYLWRREAMQRALVTWQRGVKRQRMLIEQCFAKWRLRLFQRRAAVATIDRLLWKYDGRRKMELFAWKRRRWQQWKDATVVRRNLASQRKIWQAWVLFVKRSKLNRLRIQRLHMAIWRRQFLLRRNERLISEQVAHRIKLQIYQTWRKFQQLRAVLRRWLARIRQQAVLRAWNRWITFGCIFSEEPDQPAVCAQNPPQETVAEAKAPAIHDAPRLVCRCIRCFRRYGHLGANATNQEANDGSFAVVESQCSVDEHLQRRIWSAKRLLVSADKPRPTEKQRRARDTRTKTAVRQNPTSTTRNTPRKQPPSRRETRPKSQQHTQSNATTSMNTTSDTLDPTDRLQRLLQAAHAIVETHSDKL